METNKEQPMIYVNFEMVNALAAEKQWRPLIIENVVIELPQRPSSWRERCAAMLHGAVKWLESPRPRSLKTA